MKKYTSVVLLGSLAVCLALANDTCKLPKKKKPLHEKFLTTKKPVTPEMVEAYEQFKTKDVRHGYNKPQTTLLGRFNGWAANKWQALQESYNQARAHDLNVASSYFINHMHDMSPVERAVYISNLSVPDYCYYLKHKRFVPQLYDVTEPEEYSYHYR